MHPLVIILILVGVLILGIWLWGKANKSKKLDKMVSRLDSKPMTSTKGIIREAKVALNEVDREKEKKEKQMKSIKKEVETINKFKGEKEETKDTQNMQES